MRKRKKNGSVLRNIIFIVLIVALSIVLLAQISLIASELRDTSYYYHADYSDYKHQVTYENYYRVLYYAIEDCEIDREFSESEQEMRAVGYYYEAASLYKAYRSAGDDVSAARQKKRMERFKEEAGSYAGEAKSINDLLEIKE